MDNLTGGSIVWNLDVKDTSFSTKTKKAEQNIESLAKTAENSERSIGRSFISLGRKTHGISTAALGAVSAFGAFAAATLGFGVKTAGNLESARQGFVALLQDAEKADAVMVRIKREAATTPFEIPGLVAGTQALTAITKDGDKAIDILLDIGKAISTSGKGAEEMDRVIMNLQQVASTGVVTEMDIRQFQGAIPIFNDILAASQLTTAELKNSENAADLLFGAFKKAAESGGITAQGFASQAGTFNQLWSNLVDTVNIGISDFVRVSGIFDLVKKSIGKFTNFLQRITTPKSIEKFMEFMIEHADILGGALLGVLMPALIGFGAAALHIAPILIGLAAAGALVVLIIKRVIDNMGGWGSVMNNNIIPSLKSLWGWIKTSVVPAFELVGRIIRGVILPPLQMLWSEVKTKLIPELLSLWKLISPVLIPVLKFIGVVIGGIVVLAILVLIQAIKLVVNAIAGWIHNVRKAVEIIKMAFALASANIGAQLARIRVSINNFVVGFQRGILGVASWFVWLKDRINILKANFALLAAVLGVIWNRIKNTIVNKIQSMVQSIRAKAAQIKNAFLAPFRAARDEIGKITSSIKEKMNNLNPFKRDSPSLVDNVKKGLKVIGSEFKSFNPGSLPSASMMLSTELQPLTGSLTAKTPAQATTNININNMQIREEADIDKIARELNFKLTLAT